MSAGMRTRLGVQILAFSKNVARAFALIAPKSRWPRPSGRSGATVLTVRFVLRTPNGGPVPSLRHPAQGWCGQRDSNPHRLPQQILSLSRLPIPPWPRGAVVYSGSRGGSQGNHGSCVGISDVEPVSPLAGLAFLRAAWGRMTLMAATSSRSLMCDA